MPTRTINGNNSGNTINVLDDTGGYKVTGSGFTISPGGSPPFTDTDLVINTLDTTGGTDVVNLSGLTTNSGVSFTSITINGGGGTQNVTGSGFAETISTGISNDAINAGAGDDTLIGGDGADSMDGGDGSDTYNIAGSQLGGDTFNDTGASGSDTINVTGALSTSLSFGVAGTNYSLINGSLPTSAGATYQGIETFKGNNFAINGTNNGSDIFDLSGFSSATGVGAINTFNATGGTDYVNVSTADAGVTINGGGGTQIVVGSSFADTISTGSGNDSINAGAGNDTITGGDGADSMDGGDGDDTFNIAGLQVGGDTIIGGTGNDTIRNTGAGALSISSFGPSGSGTTATYSSIETLDGNNQAINGSNATNEVVNLSLIGQVLNVTGVSMADGADTVWTAASHSGQVTVYDGGNGTDTINLVLTPLQLGAFSVGDIGSLNTYVAAPTGKTLAPSGGTINIASLQFKAKNFESATANVLDDGQVYNITDCLIPINNVVVMTTASYTDVAGKSSLIVGTAANNTIQAGDGQDLVFGLAGNDSITGGADEDCLFGGAGDDTFFANLSEAEFDDLQGGSGTDTLQRTTTGGQGNLVLNQFLATNGIERVNLDAGGSNRGIDGNANGNVLDFSATTFLSNGVSGLGGDDSITATNASARTYNGDAGNDTLNGGTQNDILNGGADNDTISGGGGNDTIKGGVGADSLNGGDNDDTFLANLNEAEFDNLQGGDGIDTLQRTTDGGQGNLVLNQFLATNGIERVNLDAGGQNRGIDGNANGNVLDFSATTFLSNGVNGLGGNDTITATNASARTYNGDAGNDTLNGGTQNDILNGGADNDTLVGGLGNDSLTGGIGNDTFRFASGFGNDVITDFSGGGADKIDLSAFGLGGIGALTITVGPGAGNDIITSPSTPGFGQITLVGFAGTLTASDFIFT
ncbi:hemolysin-type calcium-binding repeat family protein [Microcystis aeruginosa TAIHU98]|uniref:Hemolysin-type calcium-binding repeat family protein n=1 Tax=Microcystis aeruginosa TAIHU98 TaxID=1134457 RepID=L7E7W3_MICAE|nr:calcium-binding protein [Microcystis aeruginosa]ELP55094.1 hemolysin-type calcium-binding repeat family protein [Microcystis aeruginosa TAIHU98]